MKITEKTSKSQLVKFLKETKTSNKELEKVVKNSLAMFAKDMTSVTKEKLSNLAHAVQNTLTAPSAPVEASLKPARSRSKAKATADTADTAESTTETATTKTTTKTATKSTLKKNKAKETEPKEEVDSIPSISSKGADFLPSAKVFPKEIDHKDLGKIVACTGHYTTFAEIEKALEQDKTLYFACYWTKRQIKEYSYAQAKMIPPASVKNGFPNDLDILTAVLPCQTIERVFAMSMYTEALFQFEGEDFLSVEDVDPRGGDKFQIRVSAGMEFEIYRPVDEDIIKTK